MAVYQTKPVKVDAVEFTGTNGARLMAHFDYPGEILEGKGNDTDRLHVKTPEGNRIATRGDWIVRTPGRCTGVFSVYSGAIFQQKYERRHRRGEKAG